MEDHYELSPGGTAISKVRLSMTHNNFSLKGQKICQISLTLLSPQAGLPARFKPWSPPLGITLPRNGGIRLARPALAFHNAYRFPVRRSGIPNARLARSISVSLCQSQCSKHRRPISQSQKLWRWLTSVSCYLRLYRLMKPTSWRSTSRVFSVIATFRLFFSLVLLLHKEIHDGKHL